MDERYPHGQLKDVHQLDDVMNKENIFSNLV